MTAFCRAPHTYGPANPDAWRVWAADLSKTHRRFRCPDCGLWVIWRPRAELVDVEQLELFPET